MYNDGQVAIDALLSRDALLYALPFRHWQRTHSEWSLARAAEFMHELLHKAVQWQRQVFESPEANNPQLCRTLWHRPDRLQHQGPQNLCSPIITLQDSSEAHNRAGFATDQVNWTYNKMNGPDTEQSS